MIIPDEAIKTQKDDLLGRTGYANKLAEAIISYGRKESLVIGLMGEWGKGKSSIINLLKEAIENHSKQKNRPIVCEFNPWYFSDQKGLILNFFKALSIQLQMPDYGEKALNAGKRLAMYASFFDPLAIIPGVGIFPLFCSIFLKAVGKNLSSWGISRKASIDNTKKDLNHLFEIMNNKLLIIIDDIDRLTDRETRQIFQLIKNAADFPNTIYLLAFDKNVVVSALKRDQKRSGENYLDKIIQIPIEVPSIGKLKLDDCFEKALKDLLVSL